MKAGARDLEDRAQMVPDVTNRSQPKVAKKEKKQIKPKWCLMLLIDLNKKYPKKEKKQIGPNGA